MKMAQSSHLKPANYEPSKFATEFCELYCNIIPTLYKVKCEKFLDRVKKELKNIRRLKYFIMSKEEIKFSFDDVNFQKNAVRCAYLYAYSILHTSVVYREFSKHIEENANEEMLLQHFSSKTLKLCCLGGGAGFEAVGVSKAINDAIWSNWREVKPPVVIHVTIVDICSEWKSEQSAIMNELNKKSNLFHSEKVNFKAEFFKANLLKPFEETLQDIIKEANIITITKFGSAIEEKSQKDCIPNLQSMMKRVIDCMSEESCLFMLDSAGGNAFYRSLQVTSKYSRGVFKPQLTEHKAYRLHPKTLQTLEGVLNFKGFDTPIPTQLTRISSCIWIKIPLALIEKKMKEEKEEQERRRKEKIEAKMEKIEAKMERKRKKIEAKKERRRLAEQEMKEEDEKVGTENIKQEMRKGEANKESVTRKENNEEEMLKNQKLKEERVKKRKEEKVKKENKEKETIQKPKIKEEENENIKVGNEEIKGETEIIKEVNEMIKVVNEEIKGDTEIIKEENEKIKVVNGEIKGETQKEKKEAKLERKRMAEQKRKEEDEKMRTKIIKEKKKANKEKKVNKEKKLIEKQKIKAENKNRIGETENIREEKAKKQSNGGEMLRKVGTKEEKMRNRREKREEKEKIRNEDLRDEWLGD